MSERRSNEELFGVLEALLQDALPLIGGPLDEYTALDELRRRLGMAEQALRDILLNTHDTTALGYIEHRARAYFRAAEGDAP